MFTWDVSVQIYARVVIRFGGGVQRKRLSRELQRVDFDLVQIFRDLSIFQNMFVHFFNILITQPADTKSPSPTRERTALLPPVRGSTMVITM